MTSTAVLPRERPGEAPPAGRYRFGHHRALDGVRGIAAVVVIVYHAQVVPGFVGAGQSAIETFFVLSGFLITSVLRRERESTGRVRLRRFYLRRVRRLLPALAVYTAAMVAAVFVTAWWTREGTLLSALASVTYNMNWTELHLSDVPAVFGQTWSLAVEEQYYLTWPLAVLGLSLFAPGRRLRALFVLIGIALAWRAIVVLGDPSLERIRNGTDSRAVGLLVGGVLALLLERRDPVVERILSAPVTGLAAVAALIVTWFAVSLYTSGMFMTWMLVAIVASALLIGHAAVSESHGTRPLLVRILRSSLPVVLGLVSYSLYLWHPFVIEVLRRTSVATWAPGPWVAAVLVVSFVLASLSYVMVECRFRERTSVTPSAC